MEWVRRIMLTRTVGMMLCNIVLDVIIILVVIIILIFLVVILVLIVITIVAMN